MCVNGLFLFLSWIVFHLRIHHSLFIYLLVDILGFQFFTLMNKCTYEKLLLHTFMYISLGGHTFSFLLDTYLQVVYWVIK